MVINVKIWVFLCLKFIIAVAVTRVNPISGNLHRKQAVVHEA
jgi:hypothetical protein